METMDKSATMRREFLKKAGALVTAAAILTPIRAFAQTSKPGAGGADAAQGSESRDQHEIMPVERLMRDHAIANRLLVLYQVSLDRLQRGQEVPSDALAQSAKLIRQTAEDIHVPTEEELVFPMLEKANHAPEMIATLRAQHKAARPLTDAILRDGTTDALRNADTRTRVSQAAMAYMRMMGAHATREETELYPVLHGLITPEQYAGLHQQMRERERSQLGAKGFGAVIDQIKRLEAALGVADLNQFSPGQTATTPPPAGAPPRTTPSSTTTTLRAGTPIPPTTTVAPKTR